MTSDTLFRPEGHRHLPEIFPAPKGEIPVYSGKFKTHDDTEIFYCVEGEGEPLVFCYGLVCSSLHWTYQIHEFRKKYQCIWFDYRGHHRSGRPKDIGTVTVETFAQDLAGLLDHLKIQNSTLLGHSMGVNVALEFYRAHPEAVKGLILCNGTASQPLERMFYTNGFTHFFAWILKIQKFVPAVLETIWNDRTAMPLVHPLVALGGFNSDLTPKEDIALYLENVKSLELSVFLQLIRTYRDVNQKPWLHEIHIPTLVIGGNQDHMVPEDQQRLMHQLIPESELEIYLHGSHCTQMDLPDLVNRRVEDFLQRRILHKKVAEPVPVKSS